MNNILIIDDTVANLEVLASALKKAEREPRYEPRCVKTGKMALRAIAQHLPDLILLDIKMPGMDGYEVCRRLKADERTRDIPIIFLSAMGEIQDKTQAFTAGGVDYITKPFQIEEVLARVETHLTLQHQKRQLQEANAQLARFNEQLELLVAERTEQLKKAYRNLEQLDRAKSEFIQVIAHELRTPLTVVRGYAQLMGNRTGDDKAIAGGIVSGANRMHAIVNDMLDMARIDAGAMQICTDDCVPLSSICQKLVQEFTPALQERKLTMTTEPGSVILQADPDLAYKLFYHLVMNAIKYTPDGGAISVRGQVIEDEDMAEIVVADTGIGIDPEFHELIFEKFYQTGEVSVHSSGQTKFKGGGPGLGLAIVRGIVLAHNGRVWVESQGYDEAKCPGSKFHVLLPIGTVQDN